MPKDFDLANLDDSDYQVSLTSTKADRDATQALIADLEVQQGNAEREFKRTQGWRRRNFDAPGARCRTNIGKPAEGTNRAGKVAVLAVMREDGNRSAKYR